MINKIKEFNENKLKHKEPMPVYARLMDIQSELGELSKEYLKNSNYGVDEFSKTEDFELEFGDVLYSLLSLGIELDIDSENAVGKVLAKYQSRIDAKNNIGSGR